jgi:hypothetical protein
MMCVLSVPYFTRGQEIRRITSTKTSLDLRRALPMSNGATVANQKQILANQKKILANQKKLEANQKTIIANQKRILAKVS